MLSFELPKVPANDELEIFCDHEGLDSLIAQLRLLKEGRTEHVHLMAKSWGGTHLDDAPQGAAHASLRHVKILLRGP